MSWTTLKATVTQLHETNEDAITIDGSDDILTPSDLAGTALVDMYLTTAKNVLKSDIIMALKLDPDNDSDDSDDLDDIVTYNNTFLQLTLAAKQLELFYSRFNDGVDSFSWNRMKQYKNFYETRKQKFPQLKTDSGFMVTLKRAKIIK